MPGVDRVEVFVARSPTGLGLIDQSSCGTFHISLHHPRVPSPVGKRPSPTLVPSLVPAERGPQAFLVGGKRRRSLSPRGKPPGLSVPEQNARCCRDHQGISKSPGD